jgi:hypothetical protein
MGVLDDLADKYGDTGVQSKPLSITPASNQPSQQSTGGPLDKLADKYGAGQQPDGWAGDPSAPGGATKLMGIPLQMPEWGKKAINTLTPDENTLSNLYHGAEKGLANVAFGVEQLAGKAGKGIGIPGSEWLENRAKTQLAKNEQTFAPMAKQGISANIGEFVGGAAPFLGMPGGVAGGALKRAATAGLGGAAIGAVSEPDAPFTGAAKGAALGSAGSAVLSGAGKVANAVMDKVPKNAIRDLSEKFNIPLTLSEEAGGIGSKTDTLMERVPSIFGIKGFRGEQQKAAQSAATAHFGQYVVDPSLDTTAAMKVANDAHLDGLYQTVRANATHLPQAPAPEVKRAASEMLDRYPGVFESIQDSHVKRILKNVYGDVGDKAVNTGILDAQGNKVVRQVEPKFSFDDLWTLRKGIGKEIGDASTNTARGQLNSLYSAVSNDIDAMLTGEGGSALKDFKTANDAFKQYSVKFDVMRQAYDKAMGTTGAGGAGFFSPQKYGTALKNLANDPNYKKNIHWSPGEVEEMTGLANILQVAKRAGQFTENPPTGNRLGPVLAGGGAEAAAYSAAGAAGAIKTAAIGASAGLLTKFMTTTRLGKNLALSASKLNPEGKGMQRVMDQIYNQLPKFAAESGMLSADSEQPAQPTGYDQGGMVSPEATLRPTIKFKDKLYEGEGDQHHDDILLANKIGRKQPHEKGFVGPDGQFMTREEGSAYLRAQGYDDVPDSLHTQDLQKILKEGNEVDPEQGKAEKKTKVKTKKWKHIGDE